MVHGQGPRMSALHKTLEACWSALPIRLRAAIKHHADVVRVDYPGKDLYVCVNSGVDVSRAACCAKEPATVRWLEEQVRGVFYDIGANVGGYSLIAWAASGGRTRVVAFEPGFSTFPQLCRNVLLNGCQDSVTPLNVALSDHCGLEHFRYSSIEAGTASHEGLGSDTATSAPSNGRTAFAQPMWVCTLDDAIQRFELPPPEHIKIDVDGHELAVLRGAQRALEGDTVRSIQVEVGAQDPDAGTIRAHLEPRGFTVAWVAPHRSGRTSDYVFVRG